METGWKQGEIRAVETRVKQGGARPGLKVGPGMKRARAMTRDENEAGDTTRDGDEARDTTRDEETTRAMTGDEDETRAMTRDTH